MWIELPWLCAAGGKDALEGKGPQRQPHKPLDRRLKRLGAVTVANKCH